MNLSNLKVGTKLALGFGVIVLLLLALSISSFVQMKSIENVIKNQNYVRSEKLERLYVAREALAQTGVAARNAFIFKEEADAKKELDVLDQQKTIYLDALNALVPVFKEDLEFNKVHSGLLAMANELKRPRQYRDSQQMEEFGEFLVKECSPLRRQIVSDIDALLKSVQHTVDEQSKRAELLVVQSEILTLTISSITILLSIAIGVLLTKGLLKQLGGEPSEVSRIAEQIAKGNLTTEIDTNAGDGSSIMYSMKVMPS
ncbi:MCP four helix bundle domain-containing protein [Klebsiella pneumoniae]